MTLSFFSSKKNTRNYLIFLAIVIPLVIYGSTLFYDHFLAPSSSSEFKAVNEQKSPYYENALKEFKDSPYASITTEDIARNKGKVGDLSIFQINGNHNKSISCMITHTRYGLSGIWSETYTSFRSSDCNKERFSYTNMASIEAQLRPITSSDTKLFIFQSLYTKGGPFINTADNNQSGSTKPFFYVGLEPYSLMGKSHIGFRELIRNPNVVIGTDLWKDASYLPILSRENAKLIWERDSINLILVDTSKGYTYLLTGINTSWIDSSPQANPLFLTDVITQAVLPKNFAMHIVKLKKPYLTNNSLNTIPSIRLIDSLENLYIRANDLEFDIVH